MFESVARGWTWLVEGLAEAVEQVLGRLARQQAFRIEVAEPHALVRAPDGRELGRLVEADGIARFEPPDLARRLEGTALDVLIPPAWLFRRALDPVAVQSAPYLDAFVRHHIERITPWRSADVHYRIVQAPLPGDATHLSVAVGVVPKRLVQGMLTLLGAVHPARLRLVVPGAGEGGAFVLPLDSGTALRTAQVRRAIAVALLVCVVGFPGGIGWLWWETGAVQGEIDDADRVIQERKAVLAAAARRDEAAAGAAGALLRLRASRQRTVDILESLSAALPDDAYLTELTIDKDQVRIAGITKNPPRLVPALETSGLFTDAAFSDATTRVESGEGNRFRIDMRAAGPPAGAPP